MPLTMYGPDAALTAANTLLGDAPAIANIHAPTVTELEASVTFHCATDAFGSTTSVSKTTRRFICDQVGKEKAGQRTYGMETLTVVYGNPQDANAFADTMILDSQHFFWMRPGIADDANLTAGDKVMIIKATIDACDLRTITTQDGDEYAVVIQVSVQDRTQLFSVVV